MPSKLSLPVWGFLISGLAAIALAASILLPVRDARDLIRIRNALVLHVAGPEAYKWTPATVPAEFLRDSGAVPTVLSEAAKEAIGSIPVSSSNFSDALVIARLLVRAPRREEPIQSDTLTAVREICKSGRGYCADYTQAFNGLATAAGLFVREWGMSFNRFSGDGHAFSEVFDEPSGRWVFIDSYYSFYVTDSTKKPLSVEEFRQRLFRRQYESELFVVPIEPSRFGFSSAERALAYYSRGADEFFLWWGNNVLDYDSHAIVAFFGSFSRAAQELAAIAVGIHPRLVVSLDEHALPGLEKLRQLRYAILGLLLAALSMVIFLGWMVLDRHTQSGRLVLRKNKLAPRRRDRE